MNKFIISFILTSLAGLSTVIGYFVIFLKYDKEKIIAFSLSLSSAVMLTISLFDLLPSSFDYLSKYNFLFKVLMIIFFFILGVFISNIISHSIRDDVNNLKKVGIVSLIAIVLHNIPEGIITFMVSGINIHLGLELAIGISMHNIPEGISIAIPLYYATNKKITTLLWVVIAGVSEIFGAMLCFIFLKDIINDIFIGVIFSFISGMMINISLSELLPEALSYHYNKIFIIGFVLGSIIMIVSHIL
ncbi:MAG: ZIP family metal transporter [Bacilli bacterium]|nr:ZIP family metal transporter [Bacilli bacterium]